MSEDAPPLSRQSTRSSTLVIERQRLRSSLSCEAAGGTNKMIQADKRHANVANLHTVIICKVTCPRVTTIAQIAYSNDHNLLAEANEIQEPKRRLSAEATRRATGSGVSQLRAAARLAPGRYSAWVPYLRRDLLAAAFGLPPYRPVEFQRVLHVAQSR